MGNRLQHLLVTLGIIFVAMLAHSAWLTRERQALLGKFKRNFDEDGDKKISRLELEKWFSKKFDVTAMGQAADAKVPSQSVSCALYSILMTDKLHDLSLSPIPCFLVNGSFCTSSTRMAT